ncbi:type II toxin-antitoxin system YhaV family toxin [Chamaesiphon sp.]|uniref:type II toxin-antitoxin system YhaV family toxin n=1 Tax=Chamaesiphon sp. TaxID=2814140 RepID=UPI003592F033
MSESEPQPLIINEWTIFAHDLFLSHVEELLTQVANLRLKYPQDYRKKNAFKRLSAITKLAFDVIPQAPTLPVYRQGATLGDACKHWFRAKFFQQYRLFFRFHQESRIIVYAWVNDEDTKRAYDSNTDAYLVFKKMLDRGHPADEWDELLAAAKVEVERLDKFNLEI